MVGQYPRNVKAKQHESGDLYDVTTQAETEVRNRRCSYATPHEKHFLNF